MTEQRRKLLLYVLLVAAVCYGTYNFTLSNKQRSASPSQPAPETATASVQGADEPSTAELRARKAQPWGRDPFGSESRVFSALNAAGAPRPTWVLGGVIYNESRPMAFINNNAVGVGEIVNGARVVKIEKNRVTLEYNGSQFDIFVTKG